MPGALDQLELSIRDHRTIGSAISFAEHPVVGAPQKLRRYTDPVQTAFQARIMEKRIPGKTRGRLACPRRGEHLCIGKRFIVATTHTGIAIGDFEILRLSEREDVDDVTGLAI